MKFFAFIVIWGLLCTGHWACTNQAGKLQTLQVAVSLLPQQFFVRQIGGELVSVMVLVEPGASPHTYEPRPVQMVELSKCAVLFTAGVEFEHAWIPRISQSNPKMVIVPTDSGIEKIPMEEHGKKDEETDETEQAHQYESLDPHIWLSPELAAVQARTICTALCRIDSLHSQTYSANCSTFVRRTVFVHTVIDSLLRNSKREFIVFHPSWGYFAREFGLTQVPVEVSGKEPTAKVLAQVITLAKKNGITTIFTQPQFSQQAAQTLAREIGGSTCVADDLSPDWENNLMAIARVLSSQ